LENNVACKQMKRYEFICYVLAVLFALTSCSNDDDENTTVNDQDEDNTTATITDNYQYRLPVIFHVLYQDKSDEAQYIPASRFMSLLQYVNQIYQGGVYGESTNAHLTFELATTDEDGNQLSTPGVDYVEWTGDYPIDVSNFMSGQIEQAMNIIWDPNEYINVMIYPFKSDDSDEITLGVSHMPYSVEGDNALAGLETVSTSSLTKRNLAYPYCSSINSLYVWKDSSGAYSQSSRYVNGISGPYTIVATDIVVTLAHELGHYLGLFHVFSEQLEDNEYVSVDDCDDSDYCEDTPSYNRTEYYNWLQQYYDTLQTYPSLDALLERTSCDGSTFQSVDFMDYAWTMGYQLSSDQFNRIRQVLYYSPLIPGPKKDSSDNTTASSRAGDEVSDSNIMLKPRIIRCKINRHDIQSRLFYHPCNYR
jgi:zinc-dependent metalloproteinase lipoprotein